MVRQDIVAGIRNAIERGHSLEHAKQTMVNSGYNQQDVTEAANYLTGGLGNQELQHPPNEMDNGTPQLTQSSQSNQQTQQLTTSSATPQGTGVKKKSNVGMIIILVSILLLLIGILVVSLLFKDNIISFFEGLFS
jgi:hypothetical protein